MAIDNATTARRYGNALFEVAQDQNSLAETAAELSIEIASKIIQKELTPESQKELVDSYIEGLGKQNETR